MKVQVLTDRDHVLKRPAMYIGAVNSSSFSEYIFENNKIENREISYVPGLIKIINEIIDTKYEDFDIGTNIVFNTLIKNGILVEVKTEGQIEEK